MFQRQMFIDPDDNMPLATVCEFYKNDINFVFHDTPLNVMLNEFKSGDKGEMNEASIILQFILAETKYLKTLLHYNCTFKILGFS